MERIQEPYTARPNVFAELWNHIRGEISSWWSRLTAEDCQRIGGTRDILVQILQAKYGYTRERAQQEINRRAKDYSARTEASPSSGTMIAESSALGARPADHGADGAQNKAEASSPATTAAHRITFDTSEPTLRELVTGLMHDAKKLLRQEVALATH